MRKLHKALIYCSLILTILFYNNLKAQVQLFPLIGFAIIKNKITTNSPYLFAMNDRTDFSGFEINKKINSRFSITVPFHISAVALTVGNKNIHYKKTANYYLAFFKNKIAVNPTLLNSHGADLFSTGIIGEYTLLNLHFIKRRIPPHVSTIPNSPYINNKKVNVDIKSSFGITLNRPSNVCWGNCPVDTNNSFSPENPADTTDNNSTLHVGSAHSDFEYFNPGYGNYGLKNKYSWSLNLGVKFQFKNKYDKDRICIKAMYSIGLMTILKSPYSREIYDANNNKVIANGTFQTKGSYFALCFSYPITIVNKKGERFHDRHPKKS